MALRAAGCSPIQPDHWHAPGERLATLHAKEPHAHGDILNAVSVDLEKEMWKAASKHFMGGGFEQGIPNFEPCKIAKRKLAKLANKVKASAAVAAAAGLAAPVSNTLTPSIRIAALDAVNAGGATIGSRYDPPRSCPRCGAVGETARHRYYECPANAAPELREAEDAIGRTDWVALQFARHTRPGRPLEPCFWARGILPADRCTNLPCERGDKKVMFGHFSRAAHVSRTIYTDGSGGPEWALKPLRRVGAGAASISFATQAMHDSGPPHVANVGLIFRDCRQFLGLRRGLGRLLSK